MSLINALDCSCSLRLIFHLYTSFCVIFSHHLLVYYRMFFIILQGPFLPLITASVKAKESWLLFISNPEQIKKNLTHSKCFKNLSLPRYLILYARLSDSAEMHKHTHTHTNKLLWQYWYGKFLGTCVCVCTFQAELNWLDQTTWVWGTWTNSAYLVMKLKARHLTLFCFVCEFPKIFTPKTKNFCLWTNFKKQPQNLE